MGPGNNMQRKENVPGSRPFALIFPLRHRHRQPHNSLGIRKCSPWSIAAGRKTVHVLNPRPFLPGEDIRSRRFVFFFFFYLFRSFPVEKDREKNPTVYGYGAEERPGKIERKKQITRRYPACLMIAAETRVNIIYEMNNK